MGETARAGRMGEEQGGVESEEEEDEEEEREEKIARGRSMCW